MRKGPIVLSRGFAGLFTKRLAGLGATVSVSFGRRQAQIGLVSFLSGQFVVLPWLEAGSPAHVGT